MSEKTEDKGFKFKDKRKIFSEPSSSDKAKATEGSPQPSETTRTTSKPSGAGSANATPLPEINFPTFILSLSTSALMHLGEVPNPETNQLDKNLPMAKQTIDLIDMLKKKTEGNLEEEESQLITNLLYDLKLKYVAAIKKT